MSKIKARLSSTRTKVKLIAAGFTLAIAGVAAAATMGSAAASTVYNCDSNAVVYCGASSVSQLDHKYNAGDGLNSAASIQHIYSWYGIKSSADVNDMTTSGYVTKTNDVYATIDGKNTLVATDAITGGREIVSDACGSGTQTKQDVDGTVFYSRAPSVSFCSSTLSAMIYMKNGVFQFAALNACGNAVKAVPKTPNYSILKRVRAGNSGSWSSDVTVQSGSEVDYRITVNSTGAVPVDNVVVHDTLPSDIHYKSGTLQENGKTVTGSDESNFFKGGTNIGDLAPGTTDTFTFEATAGNASYTDSSCKAETLNNTGYISTSGLSTLSSSAKVNTTCAPPQVSLACTNLTAQPGSVDATTGDQQYTLVATATAKNATISKYVFVPNVSDSSSTTTVTTDKDTASTTHTYAPGTYTASVTVYATANGKTDSATSDQCKATINVKTPSKPNYSILKQVRAGTSGTYTSNVTVNSGSTVEYQITVSSTGDAAVTNVNVRDSLPSDITYTSGTLEENGTAMSATDTASFFGTGVTVPSIANGSKDVFTFQAVAGNVSYTDPSCKAETLNNTGYITSTGLSNEQSSANVNTTCTQVETSSLTCTGLTDVPGDVDATTGDQTFAFTGTATADNATITTYTFNFDGKDVPVSSTETSATTNYTLAPGTHTITLTVSGTGSNGAKVTSPATNACQTQVTVPPQQCQPGVPAGNEACYQYTCNQDQLVSAIDNDTMTVSISGFNATSTNPNATLTGIVIDWGDGNTATIAPSAISAGSPQTHTYTATPGNSITVTPQFTVSGQTALVPGTACSIPVSFTTTPPTPTLPNTGAGDTIGIFAGTVVLGTVVSRIWLSRRAARR